ncbi:MAG: hypothetical protein OXG92_01710 [Chloroflexi bacterium]|nr:hypothetical protein [Chloroflexota bacterium]MCY3582174.1 hypothetical protein [Chloroflexota bacterium]MCY3715167.1 hypothetical protein [Chloroflexota bacterium]MDE2649938.1 hypothetical protein [Chloroflexota bacterium]MXV93058.1 hypothetical protein [Chloroflexota bacterium]
MALSRLGNLLCLLFIVFLAGCGSLAAPMRESPPGAGIWRLDYAGDCQAREAETIHITVLDEREITFGDFRLLRDEAGQYSGSASFLAPMPVDGREIGYIISYSLWRETAGFVGEQVVVEGGGHGINCPVKLIQETAP